METLNPISWLEYGLTGGVLFILLTFLLGVRNMMGAISRRNEQAQSVTDKLVENNSKLTELLAQSNERLNLMDTRQDRYDEIQALLTNVIEGTHKELTFLNKDIKTVLEEMERLKTTYTGNEEVVRLLNVILDLLTEESSRGNS
jgi:archaellum component FlaC